jgi:hypothetical protein
MLFAIFTLSVIVLECIVRYGARKRGTTPAPPKALSQAVSGAPSTALSGEAASADLLRLAQALAAHGVTQLREQEPFSSSNSAASPREAAGRSS